MTLPVDGYIRISRVGDRSGESYISPDVQGGAIERLCEQRGLSLRLHEPEENVSGGTMDRPIFNEVMRRIREGESGGIVVYKLDRFARTLVGGYNAFAEIAKHGAVFASATEPDFDFSTSTGRLFLKVHLMISEYFREQSTERSEDNIARAVARGVHISPVVDFGYDKLSSGIREPNEHAPRVLEAFRLRVEEGWSYPRIATWLQDESGGYVRVDGHGHEHLRSWTASAVQRMLSKRVYLGEAFWRAQRNTSGRDAIVNPDAHEPIVPLDLWLAAQRKVHAYSKPRQNEDVALLHGIVRCAGCRFTMSRAMVKSSNVKYVRPFYRCRVTRTSGKCKAPAYVHGERLEVHVEEIVCAELDRRAEGYAGRHDDEDLQAAAADLERAISDLEDMRHDTAARSRLGTRWLDFVEPYVEAVESAEARVADLRSHSPALVDGLTADIYRSLPREERAGVLRDMIDVVFVRSVGGPRGPQAVPLDSKRVRILWRGEGPADLPRGGRVHSGGIMPWPWPEGEPQARMAAA